jgi:tetratricopeptide (TPR) repeat protein
MRDVDKQVIRDQIAPRVNVGEISLLLGAGFSIVNKVDTGPVPDGEKLKATLLSACGKTAGPKTTLRDAYQLARRNIGNFEEFLRKCFTVTSALQWQDKIFEYTWARIYTTNIDNVLNIAHRTTHARGRTAGEFKFFNFTDEGLISETIGTIPVVTIHGTCLDFAEGFVFSGLEYGRVATKVLDWHNDLAARFIAGGMVVVGNQLDESDIDTHVARRLESYGDNGAPQNWIVTPNPDEIKAENWRSAGFYVIDAKAEEFFAELYVAVKPRTVGEIFLDLVPTAKKAVSDVRAMTWFRGAFRLVFDQIEKAQRQRGILKHFITGDDPEWLYLVNDVHAQTEKGTELTKEIAALMNGQATGVGILHVIGPSGSGKTTAIRSSLRELVRTFKFAYEFDSNQNLDKELLRSVVDNFNEKAILVFHSAWNYYFAVKEIADKQKDRGRPFVLFVLEDRTSDHRKSRTQLAGSGVAARYVEFGNLQRQDARNIARKIEEAGLTIPNFSEKDLEARAGLIIDKEKGFSGDLLSALYTLTTGQNFEEKIFQDYHSANAGLPRSVLDLVAILHALDYSVPVDYVAGALQERLSEVMACVTDDLAGVVLIPAGTDVLRCRHRVIASYYFQNYIAGNGKVQTLVGLLEYLSRQFTVEDIRVHPLPYRIYRDVVSFEFIYEQYFPKTSRDADAEQLYHEAQRFFSRDGIFWLHFGRYYRKVGRLTEAIDCFRTGLELYDSFQTRHSLGMTLLESYLETGEPESFKEGTEILEAERARRGAHDGYPTATLLGLLVDVLKREPDNVEALELGKKCFNFGLKHFRNDSYFSEVADKFIKVTRNRN